MRQRFHQTRTFLPHGSKPTGAERYFPNQICLNWKTTPAASPPRHLPQLNTPGLTASRWGAPGHTAGAVTVTLENPVRPPPPPISNWSQQHPAGMRSKIPPVLLPPWSDWDRSRLQLEPWPGGPNPQCSGCPKSVVAVRLSAGTSPAPLSLTPRRAAAGPQHRAG